MSLRGWVVVIGACGVLLACDGATQLTGTPAQPETAAVSAVDAPAEGRHDIVFVCDCGRECACKSVATAAGKCTCGKDLKWAHVVKVEGDEALLCTCAEGCSCAIGKADATTCGCRQDLRRVSLKETGLYFCNCGGSCTCNHVSSKPGTCRCGMELVTSTS